MLVCSRCGKGKNIVSFSRHKKGSSGAGGTWALRAPIHKRFQRPNLHMYKGQKYCTKCLRVIKKSVMVQSKTEVPTPIKSKQPAQPVSTLVQSA